MNDFVDNVEGAFAQLLKPAEHVVVGVSGGVDSMVLLHLLHRYSSAHGLRIIAAHLNHQLRGRSSDADQRLVERVARQLGVQLVAERVEVRALAAKQKLSIEMAARQARHEFLARVARDQGSKAIALAHHADDQVELFFLRLFRGAGGDGLSGMEPLAASPADPRLHLIRPLLTAMRREIEEHARRHRVPFREDASNRSTDHLRNRIRHELLPLLERKFQPATRHVVLRTMELLSADADFSWHAALEWLRRKHADFESLHLAVQRRVVQNELINLGIAPDFVLVEWLRENPGKPCTIASGHEVTRDAAGRVLLRNERSRPEFGLETVSLDLKGKRGRIVFDGLQVSWGLKTLKHSPVIVKRAGRELFDASAVGDRVTLRHWRRGDRFQPIGMASAVKVQDLFANARVPKPDRHQRAVAETAEGQVFWIEGLRISERFKVRPDTRRVLEWTWRRPAD